MDEIKVRWKKAALENCPSVPCVVTPASACGSISTVSDIDGNVYNTVSIGTQCWTEKNLKVTKYNDNTAIPLDNTYTTGTVSTVWAGLTTGAYAIYGNEASTGANATNYGYLYNWYASKGITTTGSTTYKNLCPTGWHVPTDTEWTALTTQLGGIFAAGTVMKSTSTLWNVASPPSPGTNTSGFSALPSGFRLSNGSFSGISDETILWSATEVDASSAYIRYLQANSGFVNTYGNTKSNGFPVRCLRD